MIVIWGVIAAMAIAVASLFAIETKHSHELTLRIVEHEANRDMLVHLSQVVADLGEHDDEVEQLEDKRYADICLRLDSLEDYMRMIKSETENDRHQDYWASVMNYNPLIKKEGEK